MKFTRNIALLATFSLCVTNGLYAEGNDEESIMKVLEVSEMAKESIKETAPVLASTSEQKASMKNPMVLERAQGEELATAIGHYARARSLLIAAIHEFDRGMNAANPDALLDSTKWRESATERAKDLERLLDPQPRASKSGVKFEADTRLLLEAR